MRRVASGLLVSLVVTSTAPAQSTLSRAVLGTVRSGPIRGEDPRIAEINAYDAAGRRIYVVNPLDGRLDVIDAADPAAPSQAAPVNIVADCLAALGPEGLTFVPGEESPTGNPLLIVSNEVSSTTTIWEIR